MMINTLLRRKSKVGRNGRSYLDWSLAFMAVLRSFLILESNGGGASESVEEKRRPRGARQRGHLVRRDISPRHRAVRILAAFEAVIF